MWQVVLICIIVTPAPSAAAAAAAAGQESADDQADVTSTICIIIFTASSFCCQPSTDSSVIWVGRPVAGQLAERSTRQKWLHLTDESRESHTRVNVRSADDRPPPLSNYVNSCTRARVWHRYDVETRKSLRLSSERRIRYSNISGCLDTLDTPRSTTAPSNTTNPLTYTSVASVSR